MSIYLSQVVKKESLLQNLPSIGGLLELSLPPKPGAEKGTILS